MKTITLKSIPDSLYEQLKQNARQNHRSINSEIIVCIERSVQSQKHNDPESLLVKARQMRARIKDHVLTQDEFNKMKNTGRQ